MSLSTPTMSTHLGPLPPYPPSPIHRFLSTYHTTLSNLSTPLSALPASTFYAPTAQLHSPAGAIASTAAEAWAAVQEELGRFEVVRFQACVTRVFGGLVQEEGQGRALAKGLKKGERVVVSMQSIMLIRLKGWEEERVVEVPRMEEFALGLAEDEDEDEDEDPQNPASDGLGLDQEVDHDNDNDHQADSAQSAQAAQAAQPPPPPSSVLGTILAWNPSASAQPKQNANSNSNSTPPGTGTAGLQLFEHRAWWDSGVLARAERERERAEEKRKFREVMSANRGFLGMGMGMGRR